MFSRTLYSGVAFLALASQALANFELSPVSKEGMSELLGNPSKRSTFDEDDAVSLRGEDNVYWAGRSQNKLLYANMTLKYPEDTQNFVSMDQFKPMLQRVVCGENIAMQFKSQAGMEKAQKAWKWVDDDDAHNMILLATWPGCGTPGRRNPYVVSGITYEPEKNTAHLKSELKEWRDAAHSYHLAVRHAPLPQASSLRIRDDPDHSFSLESSFNQELFNHTLGGWFVAAACTDCGTTGRINVNTDFDVDFGDLGSFKMTVEPEDVAAFLAVYGSVGVGGTPGVGYAWRKEVAKVPLTPWSPVPGIVELGPFVSVSVGFMVGKVSGSMEFTAGARMDLSDDATASVDLMDIGNPTFEGWEPSVYEEPVAINAHITAHSEVYAMISAQLRADISLPLKTVGYVASLDLKLPYFGADITAATDEDGDVCGGSTNTESSVNIVANAGVDLHFQVSEADEMADPLIQAKLYNTHTDLWSTCIGFGGGPSSSFGNITTMPEPTETLPAGGNGSDGRVEARATPINHPVRGYYKGRAVNW